MIISHKYRFIFIKTFKTAGTSIEVYLSPLCGDQDVFTPIYPHVGPHQARNFRGLWNPVPELVHNRGRDWKALARSVLAGSRFINHLPARVVRWRIRPEQWNGYFKFCVERNPWDKTISHFHMVKDRAGGNQSWDDYFRRGRFCLNYPKYLDLNGNVIVDRVLRYETLAQDLAEVFAKLGVPFGGELGIRAKGGHRQDRTPYQEIFTPEQRRRLEQVFAPEIRLHGYTY